MLANKIMLSNSMAEMADSADDDDVSAAVISVIAFCYDSRELMYRINMDISHT